MRTTIVESRTFGDATVMVEACHSELLRNGFQAEADSIRGIEIFSIGQAQSALATLRCMRATDNEVVDSAVRYAVATLEAVVPSDTVLAHVG